MVLCFSALVYRDNKALADNRKAKRPFVGENLTDDDKVNWLNSLVSKVAENSGVMAQIRNNDKEQALLGEFPKAIQGAVIGSMEAHKELALQFLANEQVAKGIADILFEVLKRGAGRSL